MKRNKIWIDLDNSPHVPFFAPIIGELRRQGHEVVLTSRDNAQVRELVQLHGLESLEIGHHFGKNKFAKVLGTSLRSLRLAALMLRNRPDLTMSHGSRSLTIASFLLRVPSVIIFDYEFTSSVKAFSPTWCMAPESIPAHVTYSDVTRSLRYPGLKEDVYVSSFKPDLSLRAKLGFGPDDLVITIRPPASEAHYHNPESDRLFSQVMHYLLRNGGPRIVLLPRTKNQETLLRKDWAEAISQRHVLIPDQVVDGLNLVWNSDLVISGGGTMNREAAALGVPVYSIFRGKIGAVDNYLVSQGRLVLVESETDIREKLKLVRRPALPAPSDSPRPALTSILSNISMILET